MPKKFGINTKKEEAREKEVQKKKDKRDDEVRKAEDLYWKETDDKVNKKLQKEKEKELQKQEAIKRKLENKELAEKEMQELTQSSQKNKSIKGPTRRDIEEHKERTLKRLLEQHLEKEIEPTEEIDLEKEFVNPNYNKLNPVNDNGIEVIDVTGTEEALNELTMNDIDKHPEKRMRSAWNAYFERQLPLFKAQNPNAKRSQLIDMIQKEFKKSPENPVYKQQVMIAKEK